MAKTRRYYTSSKGKTHTARSAQMAFNSLGNLLFYPDDPTNLVFFSTLSNNQYNNSRGLAYAQQAQKAYKQGISHLTQNSLTTSGWLNKNSDKYAQKIDTAIQFLQKAQQQERTNQLNYFKQKKDLILQNFTKQEIERDEKLRSLVEYLNNISSDTSNFDYNTFIILINSLLQGRDFTTKTISYEKQRLHDVRAATDEAREKLAQDLKNRNQVSELGKGQQRRYLEAAKRKIQMQYLNNATILDKKGTVLGQKIEKEIPLTVDYKFSEFINKCINDAWNDKALSNTFKTAIKNYYYTKTNTPLQLKAAEFKKQFTDMVLSYVNNNISTVMDSIFSEQTITKIQDDILKQLQAGMLSTELRVSGLPPTRFWTKELPYFDSETKRYESAAGLFQTIKQFKKEAETLKLKNLTADGKATYNALDLNSRTGEGKKTRALMNFIDKLSQFSKQLRTEMKNSGQATIDKQFFVGQEQTEKTFTFTFNQAGRVIIPEGFLAVFMQQEGGKEYAPVLKNMFASKANTFETFLGSCTNKLNKFFKEKLDEIKNDKTKQKLIQLVEKNLKTTQMHLTGPTFSELISGLQLVQRGEELLIYWPGHENNKNDLITISADFNGKQYAMQFSNIASSVFAGGQLSDLVSELMHNRANAAQQFQKQFSAGMQQIKNNMYGVVSGYHAYSEKKKKFLEASQKYYETMKQGLNQLDEIYNSTIATIEANSDPNATQKLKDKYNSLKEHFLNSFYRSDTMKTYSQYQNDIGFLGGSIGKGIAEQLGSIAQVFNEAGMKIDEADLALLADIIINTGPQTIIHERYHRVIEGYLGAVASFMLFDEGGAEVALLANKVEDGVKNTTPAILHLYKLNGVYFPGSYILAESKKGLQALSQPLKELQKQGPTMHGVSLKIVNNMSISDIPKGSTSPWQAVGQKALNGGVSLQITFMAGLINILHNLEKRMSEISIPA